MGPPAINDVSTDLENPPAFTTFRASDLPASFKAEIQKHYPDLQTQVFDSSEASTVYEAAVRVAKGMPRWKVVKTINEDDDGLVLEGYCVTAVLRFRDHWVVRVSSLRGGGTVVDMRSRSRVGKGDLGTNAGRIRAFLAALKGELE